MKGFVLFSSRYHPIVLMLSQDFPYGNPMIQKNNPSYSIRLLLISWSPYISWLTNGFSHVVSTSFSILPLWQAHAAWPIPHHAGSMEPDPGGSRDFSVNGGPTRSDDFFHADPYIYTYIYLYTYLYIYVYVYIYMFIIVFWFFWWVLLLLVMIWNLIVALMGLVKYHGTWLE
jgi:hypothetical protein